MSFYWPHAFWFLLVPAILAWSEFRRRRTTAGLSHPKILRAEAGARELSLVSAGSPAAVTTARIRWRLWLGLALLVVAFARPQWGKLDEPVFEQAREIVIAVDLSRSMLAQDVKPSRLERAKLLITSLLERLAGERVGLVVFSGTAFLQSPLSADYEILREFLPALTPDLLPEGGTNYQALLQTSIDAFGDSGGADRYLIILSDGEAQSDDWQPLMEKLKTKGIRVIGLGIGTPAGAMLPDGTGNFIKDERGAVVLSKLESKTLQQLAAATNGVYTDASSWVDLAQLIQNTVDEGKKGAFREENRIRLAERFQWVLAPALLFFVWSFWREFPVRPRVRDLRLAAAAGQKPNVPPVIASLLVFSIGISAACLFALGLSPSAQAAEEATAQPLSKLVGQFSARDTLTGHDYAELASTTVTYGERLKASQQPVPEGPIRDGLAAVKAGSEADPKAADWDKLREQLEQLKKKEEPPPEKQPPPPQNKDDKDQKDKKNDDSKNQSGDPSKKSGDGKKPDDSSQEKSPGQEKKNEKDASSQSPQDKSDAEKKDAAKKDSAFGDMQKPSGDKPAPPPGNDPGETQKVGGTPEKKTDTTPTDPALAVPLQKLDQIRNQDSPARLYQLMQGPQQPTPNKTGKNW